MNHKISYIVLLIIFSFCCVTSGMTMEQAINRLKVYQFGKDTEMLEFLHDVAIKSYSDPTQRQKLNKSLCEVLADEKTIYDGKQYACRLLALTATSNEIQTLTGLLLDRKMSHMALYALTHIKDPAVDQVLIENMDRADDKVKRGIITTLGNRKSEAAIKKLIEILPSQKAMIAREAAKSLGKIGSAQAAEAIKLAMKETNIDIAILENAYLSCADHLSVNGDQIQKAAEIYRQMYQNAQTNPARGAALIGLAGLKNRDSGKNIIEALTSKDDYLIPISIRLAQQYPGQNFTQMLCKKFPDLEADTQVLVIHALVARADKSAAETLRKVAVGSRDMSVRTAAIKALGTLGDTSDLKMLTAKAAGDNAIEAQAGREALYVISGDGVIEKMIGLLGKVNTGEKVELIRALTARDATEAAGKLIELLSSRELAVCKACWEGLQDVGRADDVPILVDKLLTVEAGERKEAEKAIITMVKKSRATTEYASLIMRKLQSAKEIQVRCSLLKVLGGVGDNSSLDTLRSALWDEEELIRESAVRSLANWPMEKPMDDLLQVVKKSKNQLHRILALRGYIDMVDKSTKYSNDQKLDMYQAVMKLADQTAEQKKILAAVGKIPTLPAFKLVETYLTNAALKEEAAMAACNIGKSIYIKHGREIKNTLTEIAGYGTTGTIPDQARTVIQDIEVLQNYILDWEVSGPYVQEGKNCPELFDISFAPEIEGGVNAKWEPMPVGTDLSQPWYLDLLKALHGGDQRVAYLRTTLKSDSDRTVQLLVGSDDGNKIWLNGNLVFANNTMRPYTKDQDQVVVNLVKGENKLLLKITQNNLPWGASVRMREIKQIKPKEGEGFHVHVINAESKFEAAAIVDVNRDGRLDIFCGGFWYEAPGWEKHFVREIKYDGSYYYDFADLPADVDGDGWVDIVNAAWHNKSVFWTRNPGNSGGDFEVFIVDQPGNMETAITADINGDGRMDILPNIMTNAAWYEFHPNPSAENGVVWTKHVLPGEAAGHGIGAGDINGDGRVDVIGAKGWLEQPASSDGQWQWHGEFNLGAASIPILAYDVDADGDSDIVWGMGHNYGVYWLEQKTVNGNRTWKRHKIDDSWSQPHFMLLADLNNDGQQELITGKRYYAHNSHDPGGHDPLCVYYYEFNSKTKTWQRHLIHEGGRVGFGINTMAKDIEGDGDIDIVAPGKSGLYLIENLYK